MITFGYIKWKDTHYATNVLYRNHKSQVIWHLPNERWIPLLWSFCQHCRPNWAWEDEHVLMTAAHAPRGFHDLCTEPIITFLMFLRGLNPIRSFQTLRQQEEKWEFKKDLLALIHLSCGYEQERGAICRKMKRATKKNPWDISHRFSSVSKYHESVCT